MSDSDIVEVNIAELDQGVDAPNEVLCKDLPAYNKKGILLF